jgi:hypothetical protein
MGNERKRSKKARHLKSVLWVLLVAPLQVEHVPNFTKVTYFQLAFFVHFPAPEVVMVTFPIH